MGRSDSRNVLDDFSRRRLQDLPNIGDLRKHTAAVEWLALVGYLVTTFSRYELDLIRASGVMSIRELQLLGQLDQSWAEYFAVQGDADPTTCAHCGDDITRARKVIEIELLGTTRRFHESRPACANAARWLTITPPARGRGFLGDNEPEPAAAVVPLRSEEDR